MSDDVIFKITDGEGGTDLEAAKKRIDEVLSDPERTEGGFEDLMGNLGAILEAQREKPGFVPESLYTEAPPPVELADIVPITGRTHFFQSPEPIEFVDFLGTPLFQDVSGSISSETPDE